MKGLIEGRIVHYVPENEEAPGKPGWHRAAIVTMIPDVVIPKTEGDKAGSSAWLTVFDHDKVEPGVYARYDQTGQKVDSWHWIEGSNEALQQEVKE